MQRVRNAWSGLVTVLALAAVVPSLQLQAQITQGPGGPILVVTSPQSTYGTFYAEVLRNEGLNSFFVSDIGSVTATTLNSYDVVVLAESSLTSAQVTMFTTWVTNGGNLIAMRPSSNLASLLGVTFTGTTLANGYLLIDQADTSPGKGLVNETIQYFGTADRYTLNGATEVARLYTNATAATTNPAITVRSVGTSGGTAVAFAYDLGRSLVYARQGNPAWNQQERDGLAPIRSDDLFFGAAAGDPQADWVNLDKIDVPQADEQQRLLGKVIGAANSDRKPLPRFWYFPRGERAVLVMTGDDHGNGGTIGRFDQYAAQSPAGCSVANWECIRGTSYIYPDTPITNSQAAAYEAAGFEVGLHLSTSCGNYTPTTLATFYNTQVNAFRAKYTSVPTLDTQRHHCIVWSDWASGAKVQRTHGMRLDTSYYYWPPGWVQNRPGFFTGSAMAMRFADLDGTLLDVYQATTQMTDESGQQYPYTSNVLLDLAIGPQQFFGAFVANHHTDSAQSQPSDAAVASAVARGVPVISARQLLTWTDARNGSSFSSTTFTGGNLLSFTVNRPTAANGLRGYVSNRQGTGTVSQIRRSGTPIAYTVELIKGEYYAFFDAQAGSYQVTYSADTTPPAVLTSTPSQGATGVSRLTSIAATFNEPLLASSVSTTSVELRDSSNGLLPLTVSYDTLTQRITATVNGILAENATYTATFRGGSTGIKDLSGNSLASNYNATFTTGTGPTCPCSTWTTSTVPTNPAENDPSSVEVGVKFTVDFDGQVSGIRFYKGAGNTGTHVGNLWTSTGELLATAQFTNETATGWQTVNFGTSVSVTAGTVYVASYFAPNGHFAQDFNYFTASGVDSGLVNLLQDGVAGGNGVYSLGTSSVFPSSSYLSSNYWVDVLYTPTITGIDVVPPTVISKAPSAGSANVAIGSVITATFSEAVNASTVTGSTFQLRNAGGTLIPTSIVYDAATRRATMTPASPLAYSTTYNVTVVGGSSGVRDLVGNAMSANELWSFTTEAPDVTAPTITQVTPPDTAINVSTATAVTATFNEAMQAASITTTTVQLRNSGGAVIPATVTYDAATSTARLMPSSGLAAFTAHTVTITGGAAGVKDVAGNALAANYSWSFTTGPGVHSAWDESVVPPVPSNTDTGAVSLGVKFTVDTNGYITSVKFYKGVDNTGTHVGSLWSSNGTLLATGTFTNETATGWQRLNFTTPVAVTAGTVYVASYHAPNGRYAWSSGFFATAGVDGGAVNLLQDGVSGGNGVFSYGSTSSFPTNSYNASNYWVDVVFTTALVDSTNPTITGVTPQNGSSEISTTTTLTAAFSEQLNAASVTGTTFELRRAGTLVPATVTYSAATSTATLTPTAALQAATTYVATVRGGASGVRDPAGNFLSNDYSWSFTTGTGAFFTTWSSTVVPPSPTNSDSAAVELGVKFTTDSSGYITGIRFYKGTGNTGTHTGSLWSLSGQLLARATFTNETATGWQQVDFSTPVAVTAGTVYVASYHAPVGRYALSSGYFTSSGVDAGMINLLRDGVSGGNGVYVYTASPAFPQSSWNASNYWVDVVFATTLVDTTRPTVTSVVPANGTTSASTATAVTATFSEALDPASVNGLSFELRTGGGTLVSSAVSYTAGALTATLTPNAALAPNASYTVRVVGSAAGVRDPAGNSMASDFTSTFTTSSGAAESIWDPTVVPPTPTQSDSNAVELGVKFTTDVNGYITGLRFYKGTGNGGTHTGSIWSLGGQLLGRATFTNETTTGWQQVTFTTPVAVTAGTVYVASYHAPQGRYALSSGYFTNSGVESGALNFLRDGVSGGNGVYTYTASPGYPSNSWNASNYWVDVVFATTLVDSTRPTVTSVTPPSSASDVAINVNVTAQFSEGLQASSVTNTNVQLRNGASLVTAAVSYDAPTATITLDPAALLTVGTVYTVTLRGGSSGLKDLAGNSLLSDYTFSFTTESQAGPCSIGGNSIVTENCLTGNLPSEWDITGNGDGSIQGFATEISVNRGQTVNFKIDTDAPTYHIDIYRLGYYGGRGARKVATIAPTASLPQIQPNCLSQPATGLIDCGNWGVSASWAVPSNATSGVYIAKPTRDDTGGASHIVFIVRDDASTSDMLYQTSDTTWQAYNDYGGNSLYTGQPAGRAYKVSYNRPFTTRTVWNGEDWIFNAEYAMIRWLERNGYDVTYSSGIETDRAGSRLLNHRVFLSVGHDEYWSGPQRTNVENARNSGVDLGFFSGNEVFWRIRWEPSIDGSNQPYRTLVSYKETHANAIIDPQSPPGWTGTWRDPRFSPPAAGNNPENALTGTWFRVNTGTRAIEVPAEDGKMRFWRNTSVATLGAGQKATLAAGTLGYEWDEDPDNGRRPPGLVRLSTTDADNVLILTDWGSSYANGSARHHLTLYKHASGALVFGAGTIQWSWGLDTYHDNGTNNTTDSRMQQATVNLFADMGVQPLTLQAGLVSASASSDNLAPTASFSSPASGASIPRNSPTTISGTAADTGGGVVGAVEISTDGGTTWHPVTGRATWSYSWTPTAAGSVTLRVRASDDSANLQASPTTRTVTVQ
jgi:hypothetical protein